MSMFGYSPSADVSLSSPLPMQDLQNTDLQTPTVQPKRGLLGGMFAGATIDPRNALAGYLAGRFPQYASSFLAPMMQREGMQMQMAHLGLQNQFELQRQLMLAQADARLRQQFPVPSENERLLARYTDPSTDPQTKSVIGSMILHPVGMDVTNPDGSVTREYIYPGTIPGVGPTPAQPPAKPVGKLTPLGAGGPTPSASGGFLGS